jgi:hypothetical protein
MRVQHASLHWKRKATLLSISMIFVMVIISNENKTHKEILVLLCVVMVLQPNSFPAVFCNKNKYVFLGTNNSLLKNLCPDIYSISFH